MALGSLVLRPRVHAEAHVNRCSVNRVQRVVEFEPVPRRKGRASAQGPWHGPGPRRTATRTFPAGASSSRRTGGISAPASSRDGTVTWRS